LYCTRVSVYNFIDKAQLTAPDRGTAATSRILYQFFCDYDGRFSVIYRQTIVDAVLPDDGEVAEWLKAAVC
jgi:hypothetical protein